MIRNTSKQIAANIRDEVAGIGRDTRLHLDPEITVDHARELLAQHVPVLVVGRAQMLLDSLLSYLMEDAMETLSIAPTEIKNDFYDLDLRARIKRSFLLEPQTLTFSFDPRVVAGGVAAGGTIAAGSLFVGLVLTTVVSRIIGGLATLVASAFAYRLAHSAGTESARKVLESDLAAYLAQAENQVTDWLAEVDRAFVDAFDEFASNFGIREGDA